MLFQAIADAAAASVLVVKSVQGTPVAFCRAPCSRITTRSTRDDSPWLLWWRQIFVKKAGFRGRAATLAGLQDPIDEDAPLKRDGEHVPHLDLIRSLIDLVAVDADLATLRKLGGKGSGLHNPREEQPFVYSL